MCILGLLKYTLLPNNSGSIIYRVDGENPTTLFDKEPQKNPASVFSP